MAQRSDRSYTKFWPGYNELAQELDDISSQITDIIFTNTTAILKIKPTEFAEPISKCTNLVLTRFVTSYGRLRLLNELEKIGKNVL